MTRFNICGLVGNHSNIGFGSSAGFGSCAGFGSSAGMIPLVICLVFFYDSENSVAEISVFYC